MIYIYKIYRFGWYKNPITKKLLVNVNRNPRVVRDDVVKIINYLGLKTVIRIKENKKPYISVMLTSVDEYRKLIGNFPNKFDNYKKRNSDKYK